MESNAKRGKVYLQSRRSGKKWKPVWLTLFPQSSSGIGRLEIQDVAGGGSGADSSPGVRRHHHPHVDKKAKVVRLSELLSVVRLPPHAEACPMENMSAFCVETQERALVFAALKDDCLAWVDKLCHSTFQQGFQQSSGQLQMEENQIYASADEVSEFLVVVQKTDAATRCNLQGAYWLQVGQEALLLRETQKKSLVREWPYEMLRRYGKDKLVLTIEAGRRCESGPGSFIFETPQAEKIFSMIQATIKQKSSLQSQESPTSAPALPRSPDPGVMAASSPTLRMQDKKCGSPEDGPQAPITLMPLPSIPTNPGSAGSQAEAVYADPVDCIRSEPERQSVKALYVDPASILPIHPPGSKQSPTSAPPDQTGLVGRQDSIYSEVYDKISAAEEKGSGSGSVRDEPIYSEPVGEKLSQTRSDPDPFAHLYAQVRKAPAPSQAPSTSSTPSCSSTTSASTAPDEDDDDDDVIYENMGVI